MTRLGAHGYGTLSGLSILGFPTWKQAEHTVFDPIRSRIVRINRARSKEAGTLKLNPDIVTFGHWAEAEGRRVLELGP